MGVESAQVVTLITHGERERPGVRWTYPTNLKLMLCAPVEGAVVDPELEDAHLEAGGRHPVHDPTIRLGVGLHAEHLRQANRVL